jgi:hypothetical protein
MRPTVQPLAVIVIVAGVLLLGTSESAVVAALLVASGVYGLVLPQVVRPTRTPTTR